MQREQIKIMQQEKNKFMQQAKKKLCSEQRKELCSEQRKNYAASNDKIMQRGNRKLYIKQRTKIMQVGVVEIKNGKKRVLFAFWPITPMQNLLRGIQGMPSVRKPYVQSFLKMW